MVVDKVPDDFNAQPMRSPGRLKLDIHQAQQTIYDFLLEIVKKWPAADALAEFKNLFLQHSDTVSSETVPALYSIVFSNNQPEFHNTLKRSCYILINNWEMAREHKAVQELLQLFSDPIIYKPTVSPTLKRLRGWLIDFVESQDFKDLELFVTSRFSANDDDRNWATRYTSYLLVPQYIDNRNPREQREAARAMSRRLKDKFKFDLAMYTVYAQLSTPLGRQRENPTVLGDDVVRLIKAIVAKRGPFSHRNLARIFKEQTRNVSYRQYKNSLLGYLVFSVQEAEFVRTLKTCIQDKLDRLYRKYDSHPVDRSLILRTSNRLIDYLMTEDRERPSELFTMLLSRGTPLTLAVVLLKIILISRNSHPYLEARIADLIRYYQQFPRNECQWIINFLEIYSITFAIYSNDVEYNLVRVYKDNAEDQACEHSLDDYRVFSQMLRARRLRAAQAIDEVDEDDAELDLSAFSDPLEDDANLSLDSAGSDVLVHPVQA